MTSFSFDSCARSDPAPKRVASRIAPASRFAMRRIFMSVERVFAVVDVTKQALNGNHTKMRPSGGAGKAKPGCRRDRRPVTSDAAV
jgi:hypothetical protein